MRTSMEPPAAARWRWTGPPASHHRGGVVAAVHHESHHRDPQRGDASMRMRARRRFSPCDHALEVRLSPAIISLYAPPATALVGPVFAPPGDAPLPDPQPTPGTYPGNPPPTSGPVGPGTS